MTETSEKGKNLHPLTPSCQGPEREQAAHAEDGAGRARLGRPRQEAAGSGCSAHVWLSHSFEGFGKRRFGFVSCFLAASACLVWPPAFCDLKALAINTRPHVSQGFVVFSCLRSSSLWEGRELGGATRSRLW